MNNAIITGANGFIGSHTVEYFASQNVNVLAVDITPPPQNLT